MNWQATINGFKAWLLLERALSENTIEAYLRDLKKLIAFLNLKEYELSPETVTTEHLEEFIFYLNDLGLGAASQARLLSALKTFYKYMLIEALTEEDPTALLEGPRLRRKIPEVLSYNEIQEIVAAIDLSYPHGVRNRAIIETLYACGLRVSELIELKLSNYYPDAGL